MTKDNIWNHLQSIVPQNTMPIVREAICAVGGLPDLKIWKPSFEHWYYALKVVEWGIPLVQIEQFSDADTNLKPLLQKIGQAIANKGEPEPSDLAELDIAASLALNKAQSLKYVKTGDFKTPDFQVQWNDHIVELEVTKALPRDGTYRTRYFAKELMQKIMALKLSWRIVVYLLLNYQRKTHCCFYKHFRK